MIDIPAGLDCADAINDLPGLVEFRRQLCQAVEIAVRMRAYHERNLRFGEPYFDCRFHWTHQAGSGLVAITLVGRFVPCAAFVILRQTFVRCCHNGGAPN